MFKQFMLAFLISLGIFSQEKNSILYFSPEGEVKSITQVKVGFQKQMVPFGDPRAKTDIFEINCPVLGKARWIDEKTFLYEFPNPLDAGINCTFQLKSNIKTLSGTDLIGKKNFKFTTGGPSIQQILPYEGSYIDEEQLFFLNLDTALNESSLESNLFFEIEGLKEKVKAKILNPNSHKELIKSQYGSESLPDKTILVQAGRKFSTDLKITLIWDKGILSKSGVSSSKRQVFNFKVRENFSAKFSCDRENLKSNCIPVGNFYLNFSSPIPISEIKKISLSDGKKKWEPVFKTDSDEEAEKTVERIYFEGPFPENSKFSLNIDPIKDESERKLSNQNKFPLEIRTAEFPPLAKFSGEFGIIELEADPILPVTLRNLDKKIKAKILGMVKEEGFLDKMMGKKIKISPDKILYWLNKVSNKKRDKSLFNGESFGSDFEIQKPNGEKAFEVVGIPLKEPGFYVLEIESDKLGKSLLKDQNKMYVATSALVTNMSVHFKEGKESSLVFVTSLNQASPVSNVKIAIRDCNNNLLKEGLTDGIGIFAFKGKLPNSNCNYTSSYSTGYLVTAEKGNDFSFVHSSWTNGIEEWRFNLGGGYSRPSNLILHTILDRTLFQAGETVNMKHVIRKHSTSGMNLPSNGIPVSGKIIHSGSGLEIPFNLIWNNGSAETKFKIPKDAKLGMYSIEIQNKDDIFYTGSFNVEEFKTPLLKSMMKGPIEKLINQDTIPIDMMVNYFSGGPATGLPVTLRTNETIGSSPVFEGFEEFSFGSEKLKTGHSDSSAQEPIEDNEKITLKTEELVLDQFGSAKAIVKLKNKPNSIREIQAELEYRDPSGEMQTSFNRFKIYPSKYLVGLKNDSWYMPKSEVTSTAVVVDLNGKPKSGVNVEIVMYKKFQYSNRKRLVGGFYSYNYSTEVKKISNFCSGKTNEKGLLVCKKPSTVDGNIILEAEITDGESPTYSQKDFFISGKDSWYDFEDHDRIDLIPDTKNYEVGDTAKFQVRAPFKNSTVLFTVEREGILDHYVKQISSSNPVIEIPIKQNYSPNVFVSALALRGRISDIKPTAIIDLGRPSFKLGMNSIKVGWKPHELKVSVKTDRPVFKIREKVTVDISAKTSIGAKLPANSEVAVAVVDEALLEITPNETWNILKAMMNERGHEVQTSTAQMQVVGRRHFGIKALAPGGGGGAESARQKFDTLLFWKGVVKLDQNGSAVVEFPINDSLTSFRVVAIATGGEKFFGTGETSFRTTQDLSILAGLPVLAREGDELKPSVTIRNSSNQKMDIELNATVSGIGELDKKSISLDKDQSSEIFWDIKIPNGIQKLDYEFRAKSNTGAIDRLKISQKIVPALKERVIQGTLFQLENEYSLKIEKPEDADPTKGGIQINYSKSLLDNLDSIKEYMRKYPFTCFEQQTSKIIVLKDKKAFDELMKNLPAYLDESGFVKYFPSTYYGSPTLTSYVLSVYHEAGFKIPELAKEQMLNALNNFVEGKIFREGSLQTADLTIRKINAMEALARYGKLNPKSISTLSLDFNLLPSSALLDYWSVLLRTSNAPDRLNQISELEQIIRARINLQGTSMKFVNERNDHLWWLMTSADMNATKLLLTTVNYKKWREDTPRILRGTIGRQIKGIWDLTTANAWGSLALEKFSKEFEKETVNGETTSKMNDSSQTVKWVEGTKTLSQKIPFGKEQSELKLTHSGTGKPWVNLQSKVASRLKSPISSGYTIEKTITKMNSSGIFSLFTGGFKRGDLIRVSLKIKSDIDMTWVVINDPIPTGGAILGGLRKDSTLAQNDEKSNYPTYEERSYESYRAYYEFLPQGESVIEYTIRLNQDGKFILPETRIEAMYSPDIFGETPNPIFEISKD